jgi:aminopeptidase N
MVYEADEIVFLDTISVGQPVQKKIYRSANPKVIDIHHTVLDVKPIWDKKELQGRAELYCTAFYTPVNAFSLDAKGMVIHNATIEVGGEIVDVPYKYDGSKLYFEAEFEFSRHDTFVVNIKYTARPEEVISEKGSAIKDSKGLYFIDYLDIDGNPRQQLWSQGEPSSNSVWFPTVDAPNERFSQEIQITTDTTVVTLSNGELILTILNQDGTKTDYWVQEKNHAAYLAMIAAGPFSVVQDTSKTGLLLEYYVDPEFEDYAEQIFARSEEMIAFFSELFDYPYPWNKFAQIAVKDYVSGAMENTSAVVYGDFVQKNDRELLDDPNDLIIAHELSHHWFGNLISPKSWANIMMNESFATYAEYLWLEYYYGLERAEEHRYNDRTKYLNEHDAGHVEPMVRYYYDTEDEVFDHHSYSKGGLILHMLRKKIGDDLFFDGIRHYLHEYEFQAVEVDQFRLAMEDITGQDLKPFFDQWIYSPGHPVLEIETQWNRKENTFEISIEQVQDTTKMPVFQFDTEIRITSNDSSMDFIITVDEPFETFRFPLTQEPTLFQFNPESDLLCTYTMNTTFNQEAKRYSQSKDYFQRIWALENISSSGATEDQIDSLWLAAIDDAAKSIRKSAIFRSDQIVQYDSAALKEKLIKHALADESGEIRGLSVFSLHNVFGETDEFTDFFVDCLSDSSYYVVSEALYGISLNHAELAMELADQLEKENNAALQQVIDQIYADHGNSKSEQHFLQRRSRVKGYEETLFARSYMRYLKRTGTTDMHQRGIQYFAMMADPDIEESWFNRYNAVDILFQLRDFYDSKASTLRNASADITPEDHPDESINPKQLAQQYKSLEAYVEELLDSYKTSETDGRVFFNR